jgi:hypothetical protein
MAKVCNNLVSLLFVLIFCALRPFKIYCKILSYVQILKWSTSFHYSCSVMEFIRFCFSSKIAVGFLQL